MINSTWLTSKNFTDQEREKGLREYEKILEVLKSSFADDWKVKKSDNAKLEDFDCFRTLGTGAFGRVILVKHKRSSEYHAMKVLEKERIIKLKQLDHTLNEKKILQCVKFPFLVYLEYCFKDNTYIYLVLPFVVGGEMFTHLRRMGKFEENLSRFYAAQVLLALEYLHCCSLIYRDLKPENILLTKNGYIKLTDFGFCKMIDGRTWTLCGTPEYLAPEVILSKGYGKAVDWWSFGILVYEMAAGYPPFYADDPMKIYEKIISGKFKVPHNFGDDLRDLLKNLLQVDLTRRYGNLKGGTRDIKIHRWFENVNFMDIYNQKVQPSYIPKSGVAGDTSNFDRYEEEPLKKESIDRYAKEFADF